MVGSISSRNFAGIVNGHQNEIRELSINQRQIWNDKLVIKRSTQWTMPMIRLKKNEIHHAQNKRSKRVVYINADPIRTPSIADKLSSRS